MGNRQPKKVLNLGDKKKQAVQKPKKMPPTYIYTHRCAECTGFVKETRSHIFQAETIGRGKCEKCGKEVETTIECSKEISPTPIYSKDNPYGV